MEYIYIIHIILVRGESIIFRDKKGTEVAPYRGKQQH